MDSVLESAKVNGAPGLNASTTPLPARGSAALAAEPPTKDERAVASDSGSSDEEEGPGSDSSGDEERPEDSATAASSEAGPSRAPYIRADGRVIPWFRTVKRRDIPQSEWDRMADEKKRGKKERDKERARQRGEEHRAQMREGGMTEDEIAARLKAERAERRKVKEDQEAAVLHALDHSPVKIVIDCSFINEAVEKEKRSLVKQIEQSMVANKTSERPVYLGLTGYSGVFKSIGDRCNVHRWPIRIFSEPTLDVFPRESIVVLSPDATEPLMEIEPGKIYVIGGIVDRTVKKNETMSYAEDSALEARRLPIQEHLRLPTVPTTGGSHHPKAKVLNVNEVAGALIDRYNGMEWERIIDRAVPDRKKRVTVKPKREKRSDLEGTVSERDAVANGHGEGIGASTVSTSAASAPSAPGTPEPELVTAAAGKTSSTAA